MEQLDDRTKKILTILWAITLIVALIGATFGYFSATDKTDPQIITTQNLGVSLTIEGATNVDNIKPTTWDTNLANNDTNEDIVKIPFKIKSTSRVNGTYTINMSTNITENALLNGGSASDIKYKLYKDNTEIKTGSFTTGDFNEEIANGTISKDSDLNDEYMLYIYIENKDETQNKLQNIQFSITLSGNASQTM